MSLMFVQRSIGYGTLSASDSESAMIADVG